MMMMMMSESDRTTEEDVGKRLFHVCSLQE